MRELMRYQLWIVAAAGVIFFTNLGGAALWDMDEALYASAAREMFQRGDWVVPWFNGQMFPEKPPLMFWTMMAGFELFGVNELGARFFSAVLGVATALAAFHLGRILFSARVGLWAGLITASTIIFTVSARAATVDSALTLVTTAAFLLFVIARRGGATGCGAGSTTAVPTTTSVKSQPDRDLWVPCLLSERSETASMFAAESCPRQAWAWHPRHYTGWGGSCTATLASWLVLALMYACIGVAVLAKGPVGMVLPLAAMALYLLAADGWRNLFRSAWWMRPFTAIAVVAAVALPWYVMVGMRTEGEWLRKFFVEFNLRPFQQPILGHGDASSYYLDRTLAILVSLSYYFYHVPAILVGFFPWSVFLGPTLVDTIGRIRRREKGTGPICRNGPTNLRSVPGAAHKLDLSPFPRAFSRDGCVLASCWFGVWFVFWSICKTKLPHYLLPAYPALALLTACFIERWQTEGEKGTGPICRNGLTNLRSVPGAAYQLDLSPFPRWWLRNAWISMILAGVGIMIAIPIVAAIYLPGEAVLGLVGLIPLIGGGWCWWKTAHDRHQEAAIALVATAVVFLTAIFGWAALRVDRHQNAQPMIAAIRADSGDTASVPIATYRFFRESTVYYAGHPVTRCEDDAGANRSAHQSLQEFLAKSPRSYVITTSEYQREIEKRFPGQLRVLFRQRRFLARDQDEMVVLVSSH